MADINTKTIRNICLLGHGGSGKTSLAEAFLYTAKEIDRLGKISDKNTALDFDPEETKRGFSMSLAATSIIWHDKVKINILDTPGFLDFEGDVKSALRVADAAVIVVDGKAGVEPGTEIAWENAVEAGIPKAFFINGYDDPEASFSRVFGELKDQFGASVCPVCVPVKDGGKFRLINLVENQAFSFNDDGTRQEIPMDAELTEIAAKYKDALNEAAAETSEEMLDKYFGGEEFTQEEVENAIHEGIISGAIVPVFCGSSTKLWGIRGILASIKDSFPRYTARGQETLADGSKMDIDPEGETAIFVFKTISDQYGRQTFYKVMNGTLKPDMILKNARGGSEKIAKLTIPKGKKTAEVQELHAGDIGVISKLGDVKTGDTLSVSGNIAYSGIKFAESFMCRAISLDGKGDEDKVTAGIAKLIEEDPTLRYENNSETKQMLIYGAGDMHLDVMCAHLKARSGVGIILSEPKLAYRETIKKSVQVEGKHKKQSGGSGQYGHVKITFSPGAEEGLTFTQSVVGGSVPKGYYPAVEKGLLEAMQKGVLAGYPVVNLAADLYDGSYHDVDSNEISFKLAARLAYKEGLPKANPVLLEPVGMLYVTVPDALVGDVIGDLNKRRGHVLGMNPAEGKSGYTTIEADAPKSEMGDYVIALRAMSQGRGRFTFRVERYEEVPANIAQKVIAAAEKDTDED
ncbi:MAG: elongation factor G [Clostridia bacterium]|nr:elongation factor G [Clostridia bacterium]